MKIARLLLPSGEKVYAEALGDRLRRLHGGDPFSGLESTEDWIEPEGCRWLPPTEPSCLIGIGLNYRRHADETGGKYPEWPIVFLKMPSAACGHLSPIELPRALRSDEVDYEAELAVVIARDAKNVSVENALDYVLGYTCANDVSARDWQLHRPGRQWCRGKSFDTFCPLGPFLVTPDEVPDPQALRLSATVSGERLQDWTTSDMIFSVAEQIAFLSASTTLPAGSVILTGTPHGVGMAATPPRFLVPGDVVEIEIEGIGKLVNPVIEETV